MPVIDRADGFLVPAVEMQPVPAQTVHLGVVFQCVSVSSPCVPGGQEQVNRFTRSKQVPPFLQGWDWHSSTSYSQLTPWYPARHCGDKNKDMSAGGAAAGPPACWDIGSASPGTDSPPADPGSERRGGRGSRRTRPRPARSSCRCSPPGTGTGGCCPY